jgi:chemotaxis signal transduction protein
MSHPEANLGALRADGHLVIGCAGQQLALPLARVIEVARPVALAARLPADRAGAVGLIGYRGGLAPLYDLAARLGLSAPRAPEEMVEGRLVMVRDPLGPVGWAVDETRELTDREAEPLAAPVAAPLDRPLRRLARTATRLAGGELAPVIDPGRLLGARARGRAQAAMAREAGR